jgi:hypothetical protein
LKGDGGFGGCGEEKLEGQRCLILVCSLCP